MIIADRKRYLLLTWLLILMLGLPSTRSNVEDSNDVPGIKPISSNTFSKGLSTVRVSPPTTFDDNGITIGKWCLKLITETTVANSEDRPKSASYPFSLKPGDRCGLFDPSGQNETHVDLLNVRVSYLSKSETLLCVEFARGFDEYLENITIDGDKLPTKVVKPGGSEVISELKYRCTSSYVVEVKCKTGNTVRKTIHVNEWFPIKLLGILPDVIYWSYPVEGLPCIKEFQINLNDPSQQRHNKRLKVVPKDQKTSGTFSLSLQDPTDICLPKNITITPVFLNDIEGTPVTEYSEAILANLTISNPVNIWANDSCVEFNWIVPNCLGKCVTELRVSNGSKTTAIRSPRNNATFGNLEACRLYTFTIEIIDLDGISRSKVVTNVTTWNVMEDSVVDLHIIKNESQPARIKWNPPKGMAYCIRAYLVEEQYYDLKRRQEYNISSTMRVKGVRRFSNQIITFPLNVSKVCLLTSVKVTPISIISSRWKTATLNLSSRNSVQNLRIHPLSPNSINITWDPPQDLFDCIAYYSIYETNYPEAGWRSTFTNLTVNTLSPCITYNFVVVPFNRYGLKYTINVAFVSMPEQRISRVQQVKYLGDAIHWSLPAEGSSCIIGFQVISSTGRNRVKTKYVDIPNSEPITHHLRNTSGSPCAILKNIVIVPISIYGKLGDSYALKPDPVLDVTINTSIERQVTISWKKPELLSQCVRSYLISYDDRSVTIDGNKTTVTIQNLSSCMRYNFTIAAVDFLSEDTVSVVVNATVKEEKLSGVQDLELIEMDRRSLMVRWKPPVNGSYCVASYRYVAWATGGGDIPKQISNSTTNMRVTITEVYACTMYNVQIIPVSRGNNDGNNEITEIVTNSRVISTYHIGPVRIKNQMMQSLELEAALTNDNRNNNCDMHTVRFTCTTNNVPEGEHPTVITGEAEISDPNATFSAVVTPLQPYNEYNCTAAILNMAGWSDETALAPFMTGEDFPEQPQNLQLRGGVRMIELSWNAPKVKNGIISRYRVHIWSEGVRYPTPSFCPLPNPYNATFDLPEDDENVRLRNWNNEELYHEINDLHPYTDYVVQVAAATKAGLGPYSEMMSMLMLPEQPDPVYEFSVYNVTLPEIDKPYNPIVHISWKLPCHLYRRFHKFTGQFIGYQDAFEHTFSWTRTIDLSEEILDTYSLTEYRLKPDFQYNVSIMVFVEDVANHSAVKFLSFYSPAGIPNITNKINWGTVMDTPNPTRTVRIRISDIIFQSNVGRITNVALLVSERHCQADPVSKRSLSIERPDILSWKVAAQMPCIPQYQTTPKQWNPVENGKLGGGHSPEIEYIIGKDHCEADQDYCNGVLNPGTEYALIVRIFTNSGYSDSTIQFFQTDSLIQLTVIVTSMFVCVLLAFALGLVILCQPRKKLITPPQTPVPAFDDFSSNRCPRIYEDLRWSSWIFANFKLNTPVYENNCS